MTRRALHVLAVIFAFALGTAAQSKGCNEPAASPSVSLSLPASPFTAVPSADGCWVFVSMTGGRGARPSNGSNSGTSKPCSRSLAAYKVNGSMCGSWSIARRRSRTPASRVERG
jgi:hypothetical protein